VEATDATMVTDFAAGTALDSAAGTFAAVMAAGSMAAVVLDSAATLEADFTAVDPMARRLEDMVAVEAMEADTGN